MAIDMNAGSITPGRYIPGGMAIQEVKDNIQFSLDAVNSKDPMANEYKIREEALLLPFVQNFYGDSGKTVAFENFQIKFRNYNSNTNNSTPNSTRKTITLNSEAYEASNGSFTPNWFRNIDKQGDDPYRVIEETTDAIMITYEQTFKPNHLWQALMQVPTAGGNYYDQPGALRDVTVDESLLRNVDSGAASGSKNSVVRNHWRGIEGAQVGAKDTEFIKQYMQNYKGVNIARMVGFANLATIDKMAAVFEDPLNRDAFRAGGMDFEARIINGIRYIQVDLLPDDVIAYAVLDERKPFIARLENTNTSYRGMTFVSEKSFDKFENITRFEDLAGKFVINEIGDALWGRHHVILLDITENRYSGNTTRTGDAALYTTVTQRQTDLINEYVEQGVMAQV